MSNFYKVPEQQICPIKPMQGQCIDPKETEKLIRMDNIIIPRSILENDPASTAQPFGKLCMLLIIDLFKFLFFS